MNKSVVISYLLVILAMVGIGAASLSLSAVVMGIVILATGYLYSVTIKDVEDRLFAIKLYNYVFAASAAFATLHFCDAVVDWFSFAQDWKDEYKFWYESELEKHSNSIGQIIEDAYSADSLGREWPGYYVYFSTLAFIAHRFLDGNNLLMQCLGSVYFYCLSSIVLFKTFRLYFDKKPAFIYVLLFLLLSPVLKESILFHRDSLVYFLYMIVIYVVSKRFSWKGVAELALLMFLVWQLRMEHGMFVFVFIALYFYKKFHNSVVLSILSLLVVAYMVFGVFSSSLNQVSDTLNHYELFTEEVALSQENSLGTSLYRLPPIVREVAIFFNSQIQPFPSWMALSASTNVFGTLVAVLNVISELFWFVVFFMVAKMLFVGKLKDLPSEFKWLLLIFVVFIILNESNPTLRRLMCCYPILYLPLVYAKGNCITDKYFKRSVWQIVGLWIGAVVVYLIFKFA